MLSIEKNIDFKIETKKKIPSLSWGKIKESILGKDYYLSVVFAGDSTSRKLNKKYRGKDKPANVLSFPLSSKSGEIFINPKVAKKDSVLFGKNYHDFMCLLFVHGLLHLKGFKHSSRMEAKEESLVKKFHSSIRTRIREKL